MPIDHEVNRQEINVSARIIAKLDDAGDKKVLQGILQKWQNALIEVDSLERELACVKEKFDTLEPHNKKLPDEYSVMVNSAAGLNAVIGADLLDNIPMFSCLSETHKYPASILIRGGVIQCWGKITPEYSVGEWIDICEGNQQQTY